MPRDEHRFEEDRTPTPPHQNPPPGVIGRADAPSDKALLDATSDLIVKREERGRETAATILGQVAVVGAFLGGFSLLNDEGKAAVLASDWSYGALVFSGVAMGFALCTQFLLPSKMPDLSQLTKLRDFWNNRVLVRQILLGLAALSLGIAVLSAVKAYQDARAELSGHTPAGNITTKVALAKDAPGAVEVVTTWADLDEGQQVFACVLDSAGTALAGGVSSADNDGEGTITLSAPLADAGRTLNVVSAPVPDEHGDDTSAVTMCSEDQSDAKGLIEAFVAKA